MENDRLFSEEREKELGLKTEPPGQETQTEAPTEQPTEQAAATEQPVEEPQSQETAPQEPEGEQPSEQPADTPTFDVESFNKFFETDYQSEDDIKGIFEKASKVSDYDEKVQKLTEYETSLKDKESMIAELKESIDPMSYFPSEEAFKASMLKIQFPDKDPVIIEKMIKTDLSKSDNFQVLIDEKLMENPGLEGDRTRAANLLKKQYGIDPDDNPEEWDSVTKDQLMVDANAAKKRFSELTDKIELPAVLTPEEKKAEKEKAMAELKESWKEPINRIAQYEKEAIKDDKGETILEFDVPKDFKDTISQYAEAMALNGEFPVNEDTLNFMESDIRKNMVYQNLPKILEVYRNKLESSWQEQKDKEEGNTEPPNTQTAPSEPTAGKKPSGMQQFLHDLDTSNQTGVLG